MRFTKKKTHLVYLDCQAYDGQNENDNVCVEEFNTSKKTFEGNHDGKKQENVKVEITVSK